MGNPQLAFASLDWPVLANTESDSDPYLDKIGGSAVWLSSQPYPQGHPKCKVCSSDMYLLSQVLASTLPSGTPNASLDRILYVFACNIAQCSKKAGSFLVLRAIRAPAGSRNSQPQNQQQQNTQKKEQSSSSKPQAGKSTAPAPIKPVVLTPTTSKQPQKPPKFSIKGDFGVATTASEGSTADASRKSLPKKKKPSMFGETSAFGDDSAFGVSSDAFGGGNPFDSSSKGTFGSTFGAAGSGFGGAGRADDEISKLLAQRDKGYNAWMDDEEDEDEGGSSAINKKTAKKGKQQQLQQQTEVEVQKDPVIDEIQEGINKLEIIGSQHHSNGPHFPGYSLEFFDPSEASSGNKTSSSADMSHELELLAQYQKAENIDIRALLERAIGIDSAPLSSSAPTGKLNMTDDDVNDGTAGWEGEVYEKTQIRGVTKAFKTFQKTVAKYPEQCIRYGFKSEPLVYNEKPYSQPPPCPHCNSQRVFEMQLMPALLTFLPVESYALKESKVPKRAKNAAPSIDDLSAKGVDFGTLLIFTCSKNCLGTVADGGVIRYLEESVVVQHDEW
ncbi:UNVERIFIED_CONTAM: hypothetical protein HDU68_008681 [Siphonaria sp. JEL0065]|nr:hypothetical protein HDU68_008681 [Siphonaria sp. JEL0065]